MADHNEDVKRLGDWLGLSMSMLLCGEKVTDTAERIHTEAREALGRLACEAARVQSNDHARARLALVKSFDAGKGVEINRDLSRRSATWQTKVVWVIRGAQHEHGASAWTLEANEYDTADDAFAVLIAYRAEAGLDAMGDPLPRVEVPRG
jgi:hypothetical protein